MGYPDFKKKADGVREWSRDLRKLIDGIDKDMKANASAWTTLESKVDSVKITHNKALADIGRRSKEAYTTYLELEKLREKLEAAESAGDKAAAGKAKKEIEAGLKDVEAVRGELTTELDKAKAFRKTVQGIEGRLKKISDSL